uniref:Uncharacterized protein n=1 Tax=Anguilla anguilla TaxID=7936 RepID=A0A0E9VT37_ANGAN
MIFQIRTLNFCLLLTEKIVLMF